MARVLILVALALGALSAGGCNGTAAPAAFEAVDIGGEVFRLEVADDPAATERGLMHRASIPDGGGMLFIFPSAQLRAFWMGHCLVDIDIIFLDPRGRVTATHRMKAEAPQGPGESDAAYDARMRRYSSVRPAQFAIELPAGSLDRLGVRVDDRIELDLERLKARAK